MEYHCCLQNMLAGKQMKLRHPRGWLLLPPSILRNTKLKECLTNHMYPKDKSESDLINNCLSGTMSLGANLLSIFVPSYFLTVTKFHLKISDYHFRQYHYLPSTSDVIRPHLSFLHLQQPLLMFFYPYRSLHSFCFYFE